jgi:fatty acid desaturase
MNSVIAELQEPLCSLHPEPKEQRTNPKPTASKNSQGRKSSDHAEIVRQLQASAKPTELVARTSWPTIAALAGNWIGIICSIAALFFVPWYVQPFLLLFVAARQHALLILMHDASHFLICRSKAWNDFISDLFCSFPFGIATRTYRANHISHHEHLNTEEDPDLVRTVGPAGDAKDWLFPMPHARLIKFFLQDLFGRSFVYVFATMADLRRQARASKQVRCEYRFSYMVIGLYAVVMASMLYATHKPWMILYGWLVPMFVILPLILRLRALAEHYALPRKHIFSESRTVRPPWWERFLIAPHNVSLHLEHHLFPYVPWFKLPELHKRLMQVDSYRLNAHVNDGYFAGRNSLLADVASVEDDPRLALSRH